MSVWIPVGPRETVRFRSFLILDYFQREWAFPDQWFAQLFPSVFPLCQLVYSSLYLVQINACNLLFWPQNSSPFPLCFPNGSLYKTPVCKITDSRVAPNNHGVVNPKLCLLGLLDTFIIPSMVASIFLQGTEPSLEAFGLKQIIDQKNIIQPRGDKRYMTYGSSYGKDLGGSTVKIEIRAKDLLLSMVWTRIVQIRLRAWTHVRRTSYVKRKWVKSQKLIPLTWPKNQSYRCPRSRVLFLNIRASFLVLNLLLLSSCHRLKYMVI